MDTNKVIKAWLDRSYRDGLSKEELAQLPPHPAGVAHLSDTELVQTVGGDETNEYDSTCCPTLMTDPICTLHCPTSYFSGCE